MVDGAPGSWTRCNRLEVATLAAGLWQESGLAGEHSLPAAILNRGPVRRGVLSSGARAVQCPSANNP